jgi:hypothetical protein
MSFCELAEAVRSDPDVQRRFDEAIAKRGRIQQALDAWYRRDGCR